MKKFEAKKKKHKALIKSFMLLLVLFFAVPIISLAAPSSTDLSGKDYVKYKTSSGEERYIVYSTPLNEKLFIQSGALRTWENYTYTVYYGDGTTATKTDDGSTINVNGATFLESTKDIYTDSSYSTVYFATYTGTSPEPDPEPPADDTNPNPEGGTYNMFANLTTTAITTEATSWANHFDSLLLVVVGVGIGFACVRFVKSMFF